MFSLARVNRFAKRNINQIYAKPFCRKLYFTIPSDFLSREVVDRGSETQIKVYSYSSVLQG